MSAQYEPLLEIKQVTDHDCGSYYIGEIDFGIHGALDAYLNQYGEQGMNSIVQTLLFLTKEVKYRFNRLKPVRK